jgi:hypothetical protein
MTNYASSRFWAAYKALPKDVRDLANKSYALFQQNPNHPALQLKKVGRFWSVRVGLHYRALAIQVEDGFLWFWIGTHADYEKLIR